MARKVIDFPSGLVFHTDHVKSKFVKDLKRILNNLEIPWSDECCGTVGTAGGALRVSSGGDLQTTGEDGSQTNFGIGSTTANVVIDKAVVQNRVPVAANITQTLSAAGLSGGAITSTSAGVVSLTLPTATALATEIGATRGTTFEFIIDNSVGASVVTVVVGAGITVPGTVVITGSATLTVAATEVGVFKLVFVSTTAAKLFRTS